MRTLLTLAVAAALLSTGLARAAEPAKQAPKVTLHSADGKKSYDLQKLATDGPVLVRLTCACSGCDQELPYFQKLQAAYDAKGLKTLAVFQETPENTDRYVEKKGVHFLWLADQARNVEGLRRQDHADQHPDRQGRPDRQGPARLHEGRHQRPDPLGRDRQAPEDEGGAGRGGEEARVEEVNHKGHKEHKGEEPPPLLPLRSLCP
jgi:thiol-disulfide isomerase/thioredoxin